MTREESNLKTRIESYLESRVTQYQSWYDAKAVKMKKNYLRSRIMSAVGAVLVPIISNISATVTFAGSSYDVTRITVTVIGLAVALLIALEGVLHHKDQWVNYRSTEQYLTTQRNLFINKVGEYSTMDDEEAFKLFVSRVETAIAEENAVTLNVLSRTESEKTSGVAPGNT